MNKIPVLVTGGAGYIGSHAVLALHDNGWPVVVIDDLSTGLKRLVPDEVPFYEGDIADRALLERIFAERQIGAVMHFAGSIIVPESVSNPLKYYHNNTVKTHALVEAVVAAGIRHFIFSSTAATYGEPETQPIREDTRQLPINSYGWSKLMTERMLQDTSAAHDLRYGILRYFNVAGADPDGRSGQASPGATHLIKVACETVAGKRDHIAIFGTDYDTPDGTCIRDYIHVTDLAMAHLALLKAMLASPDQSYIFNCGYGEGHSVIDVLDAVDRVTGGTITRVNEARRAGDPPTLLSDPSRLMAELDWKPELDSVEKMVTHALAWERSLSD